MNEPYSFYHRAGMTISAGVFLLTFAISPIFMAGAFAQSNGCTPTRPDMMGPFYKPNAPVRTSVGEGYELTGQVQSAGDCVPVSDARVELWLAGPDGNYDDTHRATLFTDENGNYRFQSNFPPSYGSRPPHIHIRVTAEGYKPLVTQHYPEPETSQGDFNIVLEPQTS